MEFATLCNGRKFYTVTLKQKFRKKKKRKKENAETIFIIHFGLVDGKKFVSLTSIRLCVIYEQRIKRKAKNPFEVFQEPIKGAFAHFPLPCENHRHRSLGFFPFTATFAFVSFFYFFLIYWDDTGYVQHTHKFTVAIATAISCDVPTLWFEHYFAIRLAGAWRKHTAKKREWERKKESPTEMYNITLIGSTVAHWENCLKLCAVLEMIRFSCVFVFLSFCCSDNTCYSYTDFSFRTQFMLAFVYVWSKSLYFFFPTSSVLHFWFVISAVLIRWQFSAGYLPILLLKKRKKKSILIADQFTRPMEYFCYDFIINIKSSTVVK